MRSILSTSLEGLSAKLVAFICLLLFSSQASAHATIVLGILSTEPAEITTNEPFKLKIDMVDPSQIPVEDAWVLAEFRPEGTSQTTEPINVRFEESSDQKGTYYADINLKEEGDWQLLLRDQTFRQEEATASLTFSLVNNTQIEPINFLFPPTATNSNILRRWLIWIIALPILAGIIVTVTVLRQKQANTEESTLVTEES